jgi:serine/threonine protein kinase
MIAKIYDPLYDAGSDCYDNKRDVVVLADGDYTREVAAYEELQRCHIARRYTPEYYGSWTIKVPTTVGDQTYTRHVRLILMEHIAGTVMSSVEPRVLSRQTRSAIMEKVLQAESFIFNAGVLHRDMSPRNVMLVSTLPFSSSFDNPDLRVVIIDFNVSNVIRLSAASCYGALDLVTIREQWPGKILGPVTRFWDAMDEFEVRDWVNDEFGKANEWLWECFGHREDYVPLFRDFEDREACPRVAWSGVDEHGDMTVDDTVESSGAGGGEDDEVVFRGRG